MATVVVAFPDCVTRLGGNQYIDLSFDQCMGGFPTARDAAAIEQRFGYGVTGRGGVLGKEALGHDTG
jgi:hypothetical protein